MSFQKRVNNQPGAAAVGDFADANIRANVIAGAGALVAAPAPRQLAVGRFAWADQALTLAYGSYRGEATTKIGFVHREQQALIIPFLADSTLLVQAGLPVTLFDQGSFWASFPLGASVGQKVFANYLDGSVYAAAAGTSTAEASFTGVIAVTTGILTASVVTGPIKVGSVVSGSGVPAGTAILAQLSGTAQGAGTYQTSIVTAVASTAMTTNGSIETNFSVDSPSFVDAVFTGTISALGVLTVSAVASGVLVAGQFLTGAGIGANTRILAQLTGGAGSTGTYSTTNGVVGPVVSVGETITASQGQLSKISTWG